MIFLTEGSNYFDLDENGGQASRGTITTPRPNIPLGARALVTLPQ